MKTGGQKAGRVAIRVSGLSGEVGVRWKQGQPKHAELKVSVAQPSEDAHLASKRGLFPKYRFRSLGWHLLKLQGGRPNCPEREDKVGREAKGASTSQQGGKQPEKGH